MVWINYQYFTQRWLERAERTDEPVDEGDRFISLWIAFNGWMKGEFGERISDRGLIRKVKAFGPIKGVFDTLRSSNNDFARALGELGQYSVIDMRYPDDINKQQQYDDTFESLIETIYQIRCNLFHGRKETTEDSKDRHLVCLAYNILLPLFKEYMSLYGHT